MLFLFYLIVFIVSIFILKKGVDSKDNKYFKIFWGLILGIVVTLPLFRVLPNFKGETESLGDALLLVFSTFGYILMYFILCCIGIVCNIKIKKHSEFKDTSTKFIFIWTFLIIPFIFISICLSTFFVSSNTEKKLDSIIEKKVTTHLNNIYGDHNFKVISIEKDYSYNGIVQKYHTGYEVSVLLPELDYEFIVYINGIELSELKIEGDDFERGYYKELIDHYLDEKYGLTLDYINIDEDINSIDYPETKGHILSFAELAHYGSAYNLDIKEKNTSTYYNENEIETQIIFLKELSKDLMNYLSNPKKLEFDFHVRTQTSYYNYSVEIIDSKIKIIDQNKNEYEFNLSDI